jgi:hypothetical protein
MRSLREFFLGAGVFLGCLFFLMPCAVAGEVTLAWDRNTEPDLAGYKVYVGVESRTYDRVIDAGNETTCVVSGLEEGKTYYFAATAYNSNNLESDFSNEVVTTLSAVNQPPSADAGPDQNVSEGVLVTLNGGNSRDPDGDSLVFSWSQIGGTLVEFENPPAAQASFYAPSVGPDGETLKFQLTVSDPYGLNSSDECIVNVLWANEPPYAFAGADQSVWEGETVTLDGSLSSDPDGFSLTYKWRQTGGTGVKLSDATASKPMFTAPSVGADGETLTFELTVSDSGGLEAQDHCLVNVVRSKAPPTADAGPDQTAEPGMTVTLDGSGSSDSDGSSLSFAWSQKQGAPVDLDSPNAKQTKFVAPDVLADGDALLFELTVKDSGGLQSSDQTSVVISSQITGSITGVDLAGEWLWVNRSFAGKSGNSFVEGTLRVFNRGGLWADSSLLYVYESGDPEWDERDVYLGSATITALGAGESVDVPFKFKSNSKSSPIYVIAVIDATATLDDIDEENNIVTSDSVR